MSYACLPWVSYASYVSYYACFRRVSYQPTAHQRIVFLGELLELHELRVFVLGRPRELHEPRMFALYVSYQPAAHQRMFARGEV